MEPGCNLIILLKVVLFVYMDREPEVWASLPGFTFYKFSSWGRITSYKYSRPRIMKLRVNKKGYLRVGLWADGATKQRMYAVHRLIATLFVPNPLKLPEVNHEDRVKTNNYYKNLSWCTGSQNMQHWADTTDFSFRHTPVYCYHPNWELLKRFESQKQAKEELGIKHQSIQQSLRSNGRVKARGYRFTLEPIIDLQSYPTSS